MNRVTQQKVQSWGYIYASNMKQAESTANTQDHSLAVVLVGPIDARDGIDVAKVRSELAADVMTARSKLAMDCCHYPKNSDSPCLKRLLCTCENAEFNIPIIFETTYRAKHHLLNGKTVYGVLVTGKRKS